MMWESWDSRLVAIWPQSSPPIPTSTRVLTSPSFSILSSRWTSGFLMCGRVGTSSVLKGRKIRNSCVPSLRKTPCGATSHRQPSSLCRATTIWCRPSPMDWSTIRPCAMQATSVLCCSIPQVVMAMVSDSGSPIATRCLLRLANGSKHARHPSPTPSKWHVSAIVLPTVTASTLLSRTAIRHNSNACWEMAIG